MVTKYAIIYLAVPMTSDENDPPPNENDAEILGDVVFGVIDRNAPLHGIELLGTRVTVNKLVVPGLSKLGGKYA
jgi:hypothetical protein